MCTHRLVNEDCFVTASPPDVSASIAIVLLGPDFADGLASSENPQDREHLYRGHPTTLNRLCKVNDHSTEHTVRVRWKLLNPYATSASASVTDAVSDRVHCQQKASADPNVCLSDRQYSSICVKCVHQAIMFSILWHCGVHHQRFSCACAGMN